MLWVNSRETQGTELFRAARTRLVPFPMSLTASFLGNLLRFDKLTAPIPPRRDEGQKVGAMPRRI